MKAALSCGMPGCICYGAGDCLMIFGDPSHAGRLSMIIWFGIMMIWERRREL